MEQDRAMRLLDFATGGVGPLPVPPEVRLLIDHSWSRWLLLNRFASKMTGMVLCSPAMSAFLDWSGLADQVNPQVAQTLRANAYPSMNRAFIHRYPRPLLPGAGVTHGSRFWSSPCDAFLSLREITGPRLEIFPGVFLDLPEMIQADPAEFLQGWFLLFTLKPQHDHTLDFPIDSRLLDPPREILPGRIQVDSTDIAFIRQADRHGRTVLDRNHRVITRFMAEPYGLPYWYIEVGAAMVNSIEQDFYPGPGIHLRGSQKGHFNFGSTVVLILPEGLRRQLRLLAAMRPFVGEQAVCQVRRGMAILYPEDLGSGDYPVAPGVVMRLNRTGLGVEEVLTRNISQYIY